MNRSLLRAAACFVLLGLSASAQTQKPAAAPDPALAKKQEAVALIEKQQAPLIQMSDEIWGYAETALREARSAKTMSDYAEQQGFKVERGVAGMPTAFVAVWGQGSGKSCTSTTSHGTSSPSSQGTRQSSGASPGTSGNIW